MIRYIDLLLMNNTSSSLPIISFLPTISHYPCQQYLLLFANNISSSSSTMHNSCYYYENMIHREHYFINTSTYWKSSITKIIHRQHQYINTTIFLILLVILLINSSFSSPTVSTPHHQQCTMHPNTNISTRHAVLMLLMILHINISSSSSKVFPPLHQQYTMHPAVINKSSKYLCSSSAMINPLLFKSCSYFLLVFFFNSLNLVRYY